MQAGVLQRLKTVFNLSGVFTRFPFPALFMAIFTAIIVAEGSLRDEFLVRILGGIVLAAYLCVSIVLAAESKGRRPSALLQLSVFAVVMALAWFSKGLQLNIPMAIGAAILLLGNAVIWRQKRNDLHVWDFTHKLWTAVGFATLGSTIYQLGLIAIMVALKSLFGINIKDTIEHFLLPIGLGFLAPLFWLASLPPVDEDYNDLYENPGFVSKSVAFLGSWLLSPLTLIYALILLAYGVKIVIAGELPNGEIGQLTSPFLIIGTLTWLALEPPFISKNTLAKTFRKLWWPVSIPAALLLAVAVFVRIGEYGFTPERFALLGLVIWSFGLALWFIFAPALRRDIRLIPGFAAVLLAVGAVGAGGLSILNQGQRLDANLSAAVVVNEQGAVSDIKDIAAARRAKGALEYLMRHSGESRVKRILSAASISINEDELSVFDIQKALLLDTVTMPNRGGRRDTKLFQAGKLVSIEGFETLHGPFHMYSGARGVPYEIYSDVIKISDGDEVMRFQVHNETYEVNVLKWLGENEEDANVIGKAGVVDIKNPYIDLLDTEDRSIRLQIAELSVWTGVDRDGADTQFFNMQFYILTRGL